MKNLEIKTIEHKGVTVIMKIDYISGEASLVEYQTNSIPSVYQPKSWCFKNRGLEYMNGWLTVLEAMTVAVKECKKELEFSLAQSSAFKEEKILAGAIALAKKKK